MKYGRVVNVGPEAQNHLAEALATIAEAVGSTLGPGGRPFGFDKQSADMRLTPSWTKDGLTVLKSLDFPDPAWQAVLAYSKQASSHSVLASGDGSTSTLVLADAVCKAVRESNEKSPQATARKMAEEAERAIQAIRDTAIKTEEAVKVVALTSANGDQELADVVLSAIKDLGSFGTALVTKNPASPHRYKILRQDGYSNCLGFAWNQTLALSADESAASSKPFTWEKPKVLIFNGNIISDAQITYLLSTWNQTLKDGPSKLVIVAYEISDEVANKLIVVNRTLASQGSGVFIVKPRLTAEVNAGLQILRDIAAYCGVDDSKIIDGGNYKNIDASFFGTCGSVTVSLGNTSFNGKAPNHWVVKRVTQNQNIADEARSQFDKQITMTRNAELAEGLVKVEVGGGLLPDLQERADRFDDASKAAQSCMWQGALPGGGLSYIRAGLMAKVSPPLQKALESVYTRVLSNYGESLQLVLDLHQQVGFSLTKEGVVFGDPVQIGVLDACETVCAAIKNGVALGLNVATLGGYSYRDLSSNVEEVD